MKIGQQLEVRLAHNNKSIWSGKIKSLAPAPEKDAFGIGRFNVNVVFEAKNSNLRTGLEGVAKLYLNLEKNKLRVPRSAILMEEEKAYVSLPIKDGVKKHPVEVLFAGDEYVAIKSGLAEREKIYKAYVASAN